MPRSILILMLILLSLSACSAEQIYASGRNWQRQECLKLPDPGERERCLADADRPYGTYRRETAPAN